MVRPSTLAAVLIVWVVHASAFGADVSRDQQYGFQRTIVTLGTYRGFMLEPTRAAADGSRPWVWYAPTFIGVLPNESNRWLLSRLLEDGFAVCGVDVGESFGSPAGRAAYARFYDYFVRVRGLDPKVTLLPQSRGGLMLYNWAAENPEKVRRIGGIFPVCDLRSYPGLTRAAPAYGSTPAQLERDLNLHNPVDRLEPLAKAGIPILHVHGDADEVVPLEANSQLLRDRYQRLGGKMELVVIPGKGHQVVPEFFESEVLFRFLSGRRPLLDGAP